MVRIILSVFLFLVAFTFASAQLVFEPGCLELKGNGTDKIQVDVFITNEGVEDEEAFWKFEKASDFPRDWKYQICDLNICQDWNVDKSSSSEFLSNNIPAGETVKFTIQIEHASNNLRVGEKMPIYGASSGKLILFGSGDFVDPIAETSCSNSIDESSVEDLVIFPNPTTDMFQIKNDGNVAVVSVYNIVGRKISSLDHSQGMVHDVSGLNAGMYLIRLENKNGDVVKAMRLSKR